MPDQNDLAAPLATVLNENGPEGTFNYGYGGSNVLESHSNGFNYS